MSATPEKFRIADDVLFQPLEQEAVFLHLKTEQYFGLDPVGTRIWKLLSETQSIDATVDAMLKEYDVEEPRLRADVDKLVGRLVEKGILLPQS